MIQVRSGSDALLTGGGRDADLGGLRAGLRAAPAGAADVMEVQGLKLDDSSHRVSSGEREIALGPTEYRLLHFFMSHPERVFSRGQLLDRVWGGNTYVEERTVDVHIGRLRKALNQDVEDDPIRTVRSAGYSLDLEG